MDHRDKNIFYGLVTNENSATELFCNLLQLKPFRIAILELFLEKGLIDQIEYDDCNTQQRLDDCGCPDLVISNHYVEIVFEIKVGMDTSLTDNQPKGYLNHFEKPQIKQKKQKWLILLIPDEYSYKADWGKGMPINITKEEWMKGLPILLPIFDVKVHKIYWSQIIHKIEEFDLPAINSFFHDFVALLKTWFEREPIVFTNQEVKLMFTNQIHKTITKLYRVIDYVREDLAREFDNILTIKRLYSNHEEYGFHVLNQELLHFWFGIWYPYWKTYEKPLWFGIEDGCDLKVISAFKQTHNQRIEYEEGWYYSWIGEDILNEDDLQKIISSLIIKEVKDLLAVLES